MTNFINVIILVMVDVVPGCLFRLFY